MKKGNVMVSITVVLIIISLGVCYFLSDTIKEKDKLNYSLETMKVIKNDEDSNSTSKNEINNIDIIDIDFPFIDTEIKSTSNDSVTLGISMFQQYQISEIKNNASEMEFEEIQYEECKLISGDKEDFIIEITFNTRHLKEDSNILKEYMKEGKNRPFLRTRFHVKSTGEPSTYKLVDIGKEIGMEGKYE